MGPHPKSPRRFESAHRMRPLNSKKAREALTRAAKDAAKKKEAKAKLKAEMAAARPKTPVFHKGTHYHEPEDPLPPHYAPDAQWIKDGGWSGKR